MLEDVVTKKPLSPWHLCSILAAAIDPGWGLGIEKKRVDFFWLHRSSICNLEVLFSTFADEARFKDSSLFFIDPAHRRRMRDGIFAPATDNEPGYENAGCPMNMRRISCQTFDRGSTPGKGGS